MYMKNKDFFDYNEEHDINLLIDFNKKMKLFKGLQQAAYGDFKDATGYTITKFGERRNFNIEIKKRNAVLLSSGVVSGETFVDNNIIIETHKMLDLLLDKMTEGYEPVYINFLDDNVVIVYNLWKLTKRPKTMKKFIKSKGYQGFEIASRQGLYLVDAAIYKDNKLIKKVGEEWKS